jgi:hypothetical protein
VNADLYEGKEKETLGPATGNRESSKLNLAQRARSTRSGVVGRSTGCGQVEDAPGEAPDLGRARNSVQIPAFPRNTTHTASGTDLTAVDGRKSVPTDLQVAGRTPNRSRPGSSLVYHRSQASSRADQDAAGRGKLAVFKNTLLKESIRNSSKHFPTSLQIAKTVKGSPELSRAKITHAKRKRVQSAALAT